MQRPALPSEALMTIEGLPFPKVATGKVREIFDLGEHLLIIASDRLSAFDVVLPNGVPGKGILLTQLSLWWFAQAEKVFPIHLVPYHDQAVAEALSRHPALIPRAMLVRKLQPLPVEAVVRGYLAGSGWKAYQSSGSILDHGLPAGLQEGSKLLAPIFTPSTKAAAGHDEPITQARCIEILGEQDFKAVHDASLALYRMGSERAAKANILLADTKFEFGHAPDGSLVLIDEVLTPDSSRYWPADQWQPGRSQPSYDKQFMRNWLEAQPWDKRAPGPKLPSEIIQGTQRLYTECLERLTA